MKKLLIIAILMLALVFTVVACTGGDDPADTTVAEDTTVETPTEAPTAEPEDPTEPEETTEEPEETTEEPEETTEEPEVTTEEETTEEVTTADPADPVWIADPDAIAGVKGAGSTAYIADAVVMEEGGYKFVRITVNGGDSQFVVGSNLGTMPKYLAISYRVNADKDGEMFIGTANGPNGQNDHYALSWNKDNSWNLVIVDVSTIANVVDGNVGYFRLDPFRDVTDGYIDIEFIAFFNTAEYAAAYAFEMHKAPMWDADKAVVTHQSFDELDKFAGETKIEGVFAPGQASTWDKTLTLADFSVDTLRYWGWVGVKGELGQFGYQINGGKAIYDDAWTHATEQGVIDAAATTGADTASRMQIMISLAGLEGENSIRVLYKTADGVEVCLNEFTVILPEKPKDITNTFASDVASNEEGTDLQQSDLANFFTVQYGASEPHSVTGGVYAYGGINEMYTDVNGKYAYSVNMLEAGETAMMFVRGTHVVHSVDVPAPADGLYPINNYYETDGNGHMGGAGVYAAIYGGNLNIFVKAYSEENKTHIALKKYAVPTDATELTIADDGETLYFVAGGKLLATIALSGETTYEKICDVAEGVAFAKTAVVTLVDGTTETIENTMVVSTCASQIGIAVRPAAIKFDSVKVQAFSAIEIPEFKKPFVVPEHTDETINLATGHGAPYGAEKKFGQRFNIGENFLKQITVADMATYSDGNTNKWSVKIWAWNTDYATTTAAAPLFVLNGENHQDNTSFVVDVPAELGIMGDIYYEVEYLEGSAQFTGWTADNVAEGVETYANGNLKAGSYASSFVVGVAVPESDEPTVENTVIDLSTVEGYKASNNYGYDCPIIDIGYNEVYLLGEIDLSKYSQIIIKYSYDGDSPNVTDRTPEQCWTDAGHAPIIGFTSINKCFGYANVTNQDAIDAGVYTEIPYTTGNWAAATRTAVIDLTDITYSGACYLSAYNPWGRTIAVASIELVPVVETAPEA